MFRDRVAEFKGAAELCKAAEAVLYDPFVDLSIVKGVQGVVGIGYDLDGTPEQASSDDMLKQFKENVPEVMGLSAVVTNFWQDCEGLVPDNAVLSRFLATGKEGLSVKTYPSERHLDSITAGPLTMSARIDPFKHFHRFFYARKKVGRFVFNHAGEVVAANRRQPWQSLGSLGLSGAEQQPGDVIFIANCPQITVHRVTLPKMMQHPASPYRPRALVAHAACIRYQSKNS